MSEIWGQDIRLLRDLTHQRSRERGQDLVLRQRSESDQVDLALWSGADNLRQALLLRFLTPVGEMAELGHPSYGSRLYELIGQLNNQATRNLAKLYVMQSLAAEPRVEEVLSVTVTQNSRERTQMDISITLRAIRVQTPLNLVFPFDLAGGFST